MDFNKTYRIYIAYTEEEIDTIIRMGVFCVDKSCFLRPGHIFFMCVSVCVCVCVCVCKCVCACVCKLSLQLVQHTSLLLPIG